MCCLRAADLGNGGHVAGGDAHAAGVVVHVDLAVDQPEARLSAMGLQRLLGLRSYETAWAHMHKLRRAMVRPGRDPLRGVVEVDESYVGGEEAGVDGRQTVAKALVICAVEVRGQGQQEFAGRIRMSRIPAATRPPIEEFMLAAVERGTRVRTDGLPSYRSLHGLGYAHDPIVISRTGLTASIVMPHVHRVFALLKRWLLGTYQGGVQPHQLDYYLDEFTFRFNRRRSRHRGLLFYRLLKEVVTTEPIPLTQLVGGRHGRAGTARHHSK
jgi:ISXO2-like transposase domain